MARDESELNGLIRRLAALNEKWELSWAVTGSTALAMLANGSYTAVITHLELSDMRGKDFHHLVARQQPKVLRFMRSNGSAGPSISGTTDAAPLLIALDPNPIEWEATIGRTLLLDGWRSRESVRKCLSRIHKLPALPTIYAKVLDALRDPDTPLDQIAGLIAEDPMMTAKLLQVVNSAYFALPEPVARASEAVMHLGVERVKALILLANVFSQFKLSNQAGLRHDELWRHCLETGSFAQTITHWESKNNRMAEIAFTAGMLHDIGKLLLAGNLAEEYGLVMERARTTGSPLAEVEATVFGASHAEIGAILLGSWELPYEIVRAVGLHHSPEAGRDRSFSILTAVHAANVLAQRGKGPENGGHVHEKFCAPYLRSLGMEFRRNDWRQLCGFKPNPSDACPHSNIVDRQYSRQN